MDIYWSSKQICDKMQCSLSEQCVLSHICFNFQVSACVVGNAISEPFWNFYSFLYCEKCSLALTTFCWYLHLCFQGFLDTCILKILVFIFLRIGLFDTCFKKVIFVFWTHRAFGHMFWKSHFLFFGRIGLLDTCFKSLFFVFWTFRAFWYMFWKSYFLF